MNSTTVNWHAGLTPEWPVPCVSKYCFQFDYNIVCAFGMLYLSLAYLFSNYTKKHNLVSNIIGMIACYGFVLTGSKQFIINYYWYDLIAMFLVRDKAFILHHLATLYGLLLCPWHMDYENAYYFLTMAKTSDVLSHHYHITKSLEIGHLYHVKAYQLFTIAFTIVAWILLRVINVGMRMPFNTAEANILIPALQMANIWWITKLIALWKKIYASM